MTMLTIRLKLRIIFLCLAGVFVLFGLMSLDRLGKLNDHLEEMKDNILPAILSSNAMNTAISDLRAAQSLHALTQDKAGMDKIEKDMDLYRNELAQASQILKPLITRPEVQAQYNDFTTDYAQYEIESKKLLEMSRRDDNAGALKQLILTSHLYDKISTKLDNIVALKKSIALAEIEESHEVYIHGRNRTVILGALVLVFALGCIVLLERTVSRSIRILAEEVAQIGEGDFNVTIGGQERRDEVGRIAATVASTVAAILGTVEGLKRLIGEIRAGNLSERADPQAFRGEFSALLTGANQLVETLSRPLIEVAEVMQKLASGKLEGRMTGIYEGDLRALKANVNRSLDTLAALLGELAATVQCMAAADLRQGIEGNYQGTFAEVRANVNHALTQLRELVSEVAQGTEQSAVAVTQTATAARQVASSAIRQVEVLKELVAVIQETAESVSSVAAHATMGSTLAGTAAELAVSGRGELSALVTEIDRIAARHGRIDHITATITRIADKTQVLSINAGIEAARAGAEGRGFGVVAHQIGRLAEEAAKAASDIGTIISEASEGVKSSVAGGASARAAMERIGHSVEQSGVAAQSIAAAISQQSAAIQLVSQRLEELGREGQNTAGAAEEISATMEELSRIIHRTRAQVAHFTLA